MRAYFHHGAVIASAVRVVLVAFTASACARRRQRRSSTKAQQSPPSRSRDFVTSKKSVVLEQIESRPGPSYQPGRGRSRSRATRSTRRIQRHHADAGHHGRCAQRQRVVVETLRVLPAVSIAVTDENGTSAGPAVKLLSVRGHPHEISLTARFGGSTLFEFSETSPELTH